MGFDDAFGLALTVAGLGYLVYAMLRPGEILMTSIGWLQAIVFFLGHLALTKPLGSYMARVFAGERTWLSPVLVPVEKLMYRLSGVREDEEMTWYAYALSMLAFSLIGLAYLYVLLRTQKWLPFNPPTSIT